MLTWELVGAVVGAGLASGREIASFFSRFGLWSVPAILLSVCVMVWLAEAQLPPSWQGSWQGKIWRILMALLLIVTGGAMLSGAGEIAALTLPIPWAYRIGVICTFTLAWFLSQRTISGLAWITRMLLLLFAAMMLLGLTIAPKRAVLVKEQSVLLPVIKGLTYGGFNAALQSPMMALGLQYSQGARRRAAKRAGLLIMCILLLGNAVLLRHPALIGEAMPFLKMMNALGKGGYCLYSISLYLAILSTLTACMRSVKGELLSLLGIAAVSAMGFEGVVEAVYPMLRGCCFILLLAAKWSMYRQKDETADL